MTGDKFKNEKRGLALSERSESNGFTLIEILTAVTVFSFMVSIAAGLFTYGLRTQRVNLAYQELLDQTSYLMEYMSRAARMAKKDISGSCLTTAGAKYNYETNGTRDRIRFLNYQDKCQEFLLAGSTLQERKSTDSSADNFGAPQDLTSSDLQVVFVIGPPDSWDQLDNDQPKVTMSLRVTGKESSKINVQTTISQRNLDVQK